MKNISESTIISKALEQGQDLREFSAELNKKLLEKENESIGDFLNNTEEALDLHMRVEKCNYPLPGSAKVRSKCVAQGKTLYSLS